MKVIICNKLKPGDPEYFKRAWRIPYDELTKIGWIAIDQSQIIHKLSDFFTLEYQNHPTVILFWNTNTFIQKNFNDIISHSWTKCIYMDDLHQSAPSVINFRNSVLKNFDYVFSTYAYTFTKFYPMADTNKIIWYPHNVNNNFTIEFNDEPINKILLSGCLDKNTYPFRHYVHTLSHYTNSIDVLSQLSYSKLNHNFYGHNYLMYINKYIAAIACCSTSNTPYIVNKFFEIPATGALLMAYDKFVEKPLKELGYIDGENYISVNFDNYIEKMNYVLDPLNRLKIDTIRLNGFNLVWSKHTLNLRAKLIDDTICAD